MENLIRIIKDNIDRFSPVTDFDSYEVAAKIEKILRENGYVMVENIKEAEDYFTKKYKEHQQVYEIHEQTIDLLIGDVAYDVKLYKYFVDSDKVYSVLVTEMK